MTDYNSNDPLNGISLKTILLELTERYSWELLASKIDINCFKKDPSISSSLKFLRKTPWARRKIEDFYLSSKRNS